MKSKLGKLICLFLTIVCLGASVGCSGCKPDPNTLYVYTSAGFPPYEYVNSKGKVCGVDIDLMKLVGEKIGYKVRFYDIEFKSVLIKVQRYKNAVGASGITITEERKQSGLFSVPYSNSAQYLLVKKDVNIEQYLVGDKVDISFLSGKKIGVQLATTGNTMVESLVNNELKGSGASCFDYKNVLTAYTEVNSRLDCFVIDRLPAQKIERITNGDLVCYPLDWESESYGLYLNKNATDLKQKIDWALEELISSGKVDELIEKHS